MYYGSVFVRTTQNVGLQVLIRRRISYDVSKNLATDEHETKRSERQPTTWVWCLHSFTIWVWSFYGLFALEEKCNHCILEVLYSYKEKSWQITTTSGANSGKGKHPCKRELVEKEKSYITPSSDVQQGTQRLEEEFVMKEHCKIATKRKKKKRPSSQQSKLGSAVLQAAQTKLCLPLWC